MTEKKEKAKRIAMPEQAPEVRKRNFEEVPTGYTVQMAQEEAARCLQCKKPSCVTGCPVQVLDSTADLASIQIALGELQ